MPWQAVGIRFISFRNEQAAGYAAAAAGFLAGRPAALLTVSGPGLVHALPGAAHACVNTWPLLIIAGSAGQVTFRSAPGGAQGRTRAALPGDDTGGAGSGGAQEA